MLAIDQMWRGKNDIFGHAYISSIQLEWNKARKNSIDLLTIEDVF